jgi:GT2 family glycosyltransferase
VTETRTAPERLRPAVGRPFAGAAELVAPAAVRVVDLDAPLNDLVLPPARHGDAYLSVLLVARLDGAPVGLTALATGAAGGVSRERLSHALAEAFDADRHYADWDPLPRPGRLPSISVVVPTCGDPIVLERCLRSILACDYDEFEVIVVDNRPDSAAAAVMLFEQFADDPRVRYVEESRPGASWARNAGLALADGEIVAFADDDVVVDPAWLQRSAAALETSDDVACATGLILPFELETEAQLLFEQFAGLGKGFERQTFRMAGQDAHSLLRYTPGVIGSGANAAMRADVARALNGFDTTLGPRTPTCGAEDLDLFTRVLRAGYAIAYEPSAVVWHEHPDGMRRLHRQAFRYGVGLGGMLGRQFITGPERLELLRAVPAGMRYSLDQGSRKNAAKPIDYPRRLDWLERAGLLVGPFAYLMSALVTARRPQVLPGTATQGEAGSPVVERLPLGDGKSVKVLSFRAGEAAVARRLAVPARRAISRRAPSAVVVAAAAACVAAPLLVAVGAPAAMRLPAVLALMCLAPGAALLAALGARIEAGLAIGLSLAATAVAMQSMLWLGAWSPETALYVLAAVCAVPLFGAPHAGRPRPRAGPIVERLRPSTDVAAHIAVVTAAMIAWGTSLTGADLSKIDGLGLVSALPPGYFLALALLIVGFVAAVSRSIVAPRLLGLYVVALIVVVHATAPLLYGEPRYVWTFKHLGVIEFIGQNGAADRDIDIYNNWPAFFALNAWFSRAAGVSPGSYAEWAQLFFNLANVVALRFALRGLTRDERLIWTATWLFVLANFVGQDYLAPQAFGFLVSLVALGACLRLAPPAGPPRTRPGRWWLGRLQRLRRRFVLGDVEDPVPLAPLGRTAGLTAVGLCSVAVILSHQLSPLMLVLSIAALALIARRVPLWLPIALALVEVWWVALAWPFLSRHFVIFDPNPVESTRPDGGEGLPGLTLVTLAPWAGAALVAALAAIGVVRRLRAGHWDLAAAALVVGPLAVAGIQSYGGEGRIRLFLFTLPWLCFFAATACTPALSTRLRGALRGWRVAASSAAIGLCLVFAYFGSEYINRISRDDVEAATWFERHAPARSSLASVIGPFPHRLTARYPVVYANAFTLIKDSSYRGGRLPHFGLARLKRDLRDLRRPRFVVTSRSQHRYARLYGLLPQGSLARLEDALGRSRSFRLVHRRGATSIYEDVRPRRTGLASAQPRGTLPAVPRGGG